MSRCFGQRLLVVSAILGVAVPLVAAPGAVGVGDVSADLEISVVSGKADMVTGGDALVRVAVPRDVVPHQVRIEVDGQDRTDAFEADYSDWSLQGVVTGLAEGSTEVKAEVRGSSDAKDELTVVKHPIEGPVFSGPHEQPFACQSENFKLPVLGGTLGPPVDENCSLETRVDHIYRTTADAYAPWPADASSYPEDLAMTTTSEDREVPFIVRIERGTVNRSIYEMAMLHDPLAEPEPSASTPPAAWNGAAIFTLGLGCGNGWYRQGQKTAGVTDAFQLGQGYAVMSSSLNVSTINCNDVLAAETAMMVKERFTESYGPMEHTIGFGCSGGSYQAHQISDNYPGIFDGIIVGCSFPDPAFASGYFTSDAQLLHNYFTGSDIDWSAEQKRAVTGFVTYATAPAVIRNSRAISATAQCAMVPQEDRYHPDTNPDGVRCGIFDHQVNIYGRDPETGFARRPIDNVGVQYGLGVLNDGTITPDQFLDLNENVGGFNNDGNRGPQRTQGDPAAIRTAYQTGRLTNGGGGLAEIPIIDQRNYTDDNPKGNVHLRYHTLSMRERLLKANGTTANQVSLLYDRHIGGNSPIQHAITEMDTWLTTLADDDSDRPEIEKIADARPSALREGCWTREDNPTFIAEELNRDPDSRCEQLYPSASFPREVAGGDIAADVIKCQLTEPNRDDYAVEFSDEQWARLQNIFAEGVCDYSRPGVEQQGLIGTWLRY